MRRGVRLARHRLLGLLLTGLLLCSFLPITVFAQDETGITETEAAAQIEDTASTDTQGETEITGNPDDSAEIEPPTDETDEVPGDDTEEATEDTTEPDALLDAENEETLLELTAFGAAADMSAPDVVNNMDELEIWLAENPQGGTITLGADIEITEPVRLYLCRVEAESAIVLPAWVTLDTCIVSPYISGGTVISRKISRVTPPSSFLFAAGDKAAGYFTGASVRCALTLSADGVDDEDEMAFILFDDSGVDYNKPGEYLLPGVFEPPYDDLYAFDIVAEACPLAITLTIYDPAIPYFYSYYKARGGVFVICYYYSGDFDALTLWRSDDGGESWRVYWQPGDEDSEKFQVNHDDYSLDLLFLDSAELEAPALFVFEVGVGVGSDILYVDAGAVKNMGDGGDRDSGDRILLPWEFFFGTPGDDDSGGENEDTGGNTNPPPNTGDETPDPGDEGNQGSGDSGDSDGSDGSGGNGNHDGDANTEPDTGEKQPDGDNNGGGDNGHAGDYIPVSVVPGIEVADATVPAGTAPLDTQGNMIASTIAAVASGPIPGAPGEPDPAAATVEYEDETTIAISGKRLEALLRTNTKMVPFARQGIQVWIPAGLLAGLHLADTDIFAVNIEKPAQSSVSVLFTMNGKALVEPFAEPFLVGIPWSETNGEIVCTDSSGKAIPFEYDRQNGLLILTLYECGTCTIEAGPGVGIAINSVDTPLSGNPAEVVPEPNSKHAPTSFPFFPILAMSLTGVGGVGGLAYVFRKRRVKRVI